MIFIKPKREPDFIVVKTNVYSGKEFLYYWIKEEIGCWTTDNEGASSQTYPIRVINNILHWKDFTDSEPKWLKEDKTTQNEYQKWLVAKTILKGK